MKLRSRLTSKSCMLLLTGLAFFSSCQKASSSSSSSEIAPSTNFNLSSWKLDLPIDSSGGTGGINGIQLEAESVSAAQLENGFVDSYFYENTVGQIVFTAPSNGAVTTPGFGSDHTRSELREIYSGVGADSSNNWNSSIGGTLTAKCFVRSVSVNSDEATIGQIHNGNVAFALLIYRPSYNDIALSLYTTPTSGVSQRTSLVSGVSLETPITYSLNYSGNTLIATVNGTTQSFNIDSSWAGTPMYFKLGAYHAAPNTGNIAGDQTQVVFSSFSANH